MSRYVARNLKHKQKNWSLATQKRIAMTATILGSTKSMKMLGMAETVTSNIEGLRDNEIEMSKRLRWMNVVYNASGQFTEAMTNRRLTILSKCHRHLLSGDHFDCLRHCLSVQSRMGFR